MEQAKVFKTSDNKSVKKKVFHHDTAGIIIYAREEKWNTDIYFAKKDEYDHVTKTAWMNPTSKLFAINRSINGYFQGQIFFIFFYDRTAIFGKDFIVIILVSIQFETDFFQRLGNFF